MPRFFSALALALALTLSSRAADWPQFLGPNRDNTSPETVAAWAGDLKPAWKKPVGESHASPVVAGGVVYVFDQPKGKNADRLMGFDAKTGDLKFDKSYEREEFTPLFGNGPRGTPAVAGDRVVTLGGTGVLAAWDAATGEVKWKRDLLKEFKADNLGFGMSASPLAAGGKVYVNVGGKGAGVVAFDLATGDPVWKATDDGASYASPILTAGKTPELVCLTKQNLLGLNPATGDVYWKVPFQDRMSESATTPLVAGDLLVGSSVTLGAIGLKRTAKDGKPAVEPVWRKRELNCYFSTPAVVGDDLYMLNGVLSLTPSISLRCVEAKTGKVRWTKENIGNYHAALIRLADDKLLMLDDKGFLTLIRPDPAGYKELARSKVCGPTWAHPALVGGRLYLRDEKELMAFDLAAK